VRMQVKLVIWPRKDRRVRGQDRRESVPANCGGQSGGCSSLAALEEKSAPAGIESGEICPTGILRKSRCMLRLGWTQNSCLAKQGNIAEI
jgi:hypothetical protein